MGCRCLSSTYFHLPQKSVISTGGGAFAAVVERPALVFALAVCLFIVIPKGSQTSFGSFLSTPSSCGKLQNPNNHAANFPSQKWHASFTQSTKIEVEIKKAPVNQPGLSHFLQPDGCKSFGWTNLAVNPLERLI
jgi:hypothetical protein